jgi:hypothetical protein
MKRSGNIAQPSGETLKGIAGAVVKQAVLFIAPLALPHRCPAWTTTEQSSKRSGNCQTQDFLFGQQTPTLKPQKAADTHD